MNYKRNIKSGKFEQIYTVNSDFFDNIGEIQSYLLGLYSADGSIHKNNSISISQSHKNGYELLYKIKDILKYSGKIYYYKKTDSYTLSFIDNKILNIFSTYNIVNNKTYIFKFPDILSSDLYPSFIRGYIDGDGSCGIYDNGNGCKVLTISFVGTKDFIYFCNSIIPIKGNITEIKKAKNLYEIRFYGEKAVDFGNWIWSNDKLPKYYKQKYYFDFIHTSNAKYFLYKDVKLKAIQMLKEGKKVKDISKILAIKPTVIWNWKYRKL